MSKPILITGATGTIGRDVAKRLSEKGVSVRAAVRDQAKARRQFGSNIALAPFDFENEKTFSGALEGGRESFSSAAAAAKSAGGNECICRCRETRRRSPYCE